jgi:hypothetical protein
LQEIHFPFIPVLYTLITDFQDCWPRLCACYQYALCLCAFLCLLPPAMGLCASAVVCMHACLSIAPLCRYAYVSIWISLVVCVAFLSICTACLPACLHALLILWYESALSIYMGRVALPSVPCSCIRMCLWWFIFSGSSSGMVPSVISATFR